MGNFRKKSSLGILSLGCALIVGELCLLQNFNHDMEELGSRIGNLFRSVGYFTWAVMRAERVTRVLVQSNHSAAGTTKFCWDWRAWQELNARESLRSAKLEESERRAIAEAIEAQLRPKMSDLEIDSQKDLEKAVLDTRVKLIELNADGVPEVVAQGMINCGATGNCPFWILQKKAKSYRVLLESYGQTFTIQMKSSNGFHDIVVSTHNSATRSGLAEYHYKSGKYEVAGCYNAEWEVLEHGQVQESKEPRITPYPCTL
jgi:hypothetical protein